MPKPPTDDYDINDGGESFTISLPKGTKVSNDFFARAVKQYRSRKSTGPVQPRNDAQTNTGAYDTAPVVPTNVYAKNMYGPDVHVPLDIAQDPDKFDAYVSKNQPAGDKWRGFNGGLNDFIGMMVGDPHAATRYQKRVGGPSAMLGNLWQQSVARPAQALYGNLNNPNTPLGKFSEFISDSDPSQDRDPYASTIGTEAYKYAPSDAFSPVTAGIQHGSATGPAGMGAAVGLGTAASRLMPGGPVPKAIAGAVGGAVGFLGGGAIADKAIDPVNQFLYGPDTAQYMHLYDEQQKQASPGGYGAGELAAQLPYAGFENPATYLPGLLKAGTAAKAGDVAAQKYIASQVPNVALGAGNVASTGLKAARGEFKDKNGGNDWITPLALSVAGAHMTKPGIVPMLGHNFMHPTAGVDVQPNDSILNQLNGEPDPTQPVPVKTGNDVQPLLKSDQYAGKDFFAKVRKNSKTAQVFRADGVDETGNVIGIITSEGPNKGKSARFRPDQLLALDNPNKSESTGPQTPESKAANDEAMKTANTVADNAQTLLAKRPHLSPGEQVVHDGSTYTVKELFPSGPDEGEVTLEGDDGTLKHDVNIEEVKPFTPAVGDNPTVTPTASPALKGNSGPVVPPVKPPGKPKAVPTPKVAPVAVSPQPVQLKGADHYQEAFYNWVKGGQTGAAPSPLDFGLKDPAQISKLKQDAVSSTSGYIPISQRQAQPTPDAVYDSGKNENLEFASNTGSDHASLGRPKDATILKGTGTYTPAGIKAYNDSYDSGTRRDSTTSPVDAPTQPHSIPEQKTGQTPEQQKANARAKKQTPAEAADIRANVPVDESTGTSDFDMEGDNVPETPEQQHRTAFDDFIANAKDDNGNPIEGNPDAMKEMVKNIARKARSLNRRTNAIIDANPSADLTKNKTFMALQEEEKQHFATIKMLNERIAEHEANAAKEATDKAGCTDGP